VGGRFFPGLLVAAAALADSRGRHGLALDALLTAVPFAAVAAIAAFGGYLDRRDDAVVALQALLWAVALVLLIVSCEVRSNAIHGVPRLAISSLVACLGVFAIKAAVAVAPHVRRLGELRPAKP
jgi:cyanate permease